MKRIGGIGRGTRSKYRKNYRNRGKFKISRFIQTLKEGDKVSLGVESSYKKGMYHPRFFGKIGKVAGKKGGCYEVKIIDNKKPKTLLVHPVHLKKV